MHQKLRIGHSKSALCAHLFRKGKEASEASFEPDLDLVYEMLDRDIRVQDLLECLSFNIVEAPAHMRALAEWYTRREGKAISVPLPASASAAPES